MKKNEMTFKSSSFKESTERSLLEYFSGDSTRNILWKQNKTRIYQENLKNAQDREWQVIGSMFLLLQMPSIGGNFVTSAMQQNTSNDTITDVFERDDDTLWWKLTR